MTTYLSPDLLKFMDIYQRYRNICTVNNFHYKFINSFYTLNPCFLMQVLCASIRSKQFSSPRSTMLKEGGGGGGGGKK